LKLHPVKVNLNSYLFFGCLRYSDRKFLVKNLDGVRDRDGVLSLDGPTKLALFEGLKGAFQQALAVSNKEEINTAWSGVLLLTEDAVVGRMVADFIYRAIEDDITRLMQATEPENEYLERALLYNPYKLLTT
jgi:hypothetical protein